MKIDDIRTVLVVGAGTMGRQIALQCATHGYNVTLYDMTAQALEAASRQIEEYAALLVSFGRLTRQDADAALVRIRNTGNAQEAASGVDLLIECVPEDPELKGNVLAQFNRFCPRHTVFATNTSWLLPSMFAQATGRPPQFAAFHFHQHVWEANVADVMPHPGTSPETVDLLRAFALRIGQVPIVLKKENPGYLFNAMLGGVNRVAMDLLVNDVASVEDIDAAWKGATRMVVGPFGMLDFVGLDVALDIVERRVQTEGTAQSRAHAALLKQYVDRGWLGVKSGRGFYNYT